MELCFSEDAQRLQGRVREFLASHWPVERRTRQRVAPQASLVPDPEERAFVSALVDAGWSVPAWPVAFGGTGWTPEQHYVFRREMALAAAPEMDACGIGLVGPMLCAWGSDAQHARFLDDIRAARARWCQGFAEQAAGSDLRAVSTLACRDRASPGDYLVDGSKLWTSGASAADWMAALVRVDAGGANTYAAAAPEFAIALIRLRDDGVEVTPVQTLGGQHNVDRVTLSGVRVPAANLIAAPADAGSLARWPAAGLAGAAGAAVARAETQLDLVRELAPTVGAGAVSLLDDPAFARKVAELEIGLAGLRALELRAVAALATDSEDDAWPLTGIVRLRGAELGQQIGELQIEMFGYDAVPFPDPVLAHNEGSVGHEYALDAVNGYLFGRSWTIDGGTSEIQKNMMAKTVLGLGG